MSEVLFPGGREDSIVTDPDKPGGKDVLAEPAQELRSFEVHDLLLVVSVVAPPEDYAMIVDAEQTMVRDGDFVGVSSQVFDHRGRAGKGFFGVHHPFMFS